MGGTDPEHDNFTGHDEKARPETWIALDLDGTLAEYHGWKGIEHIGRPIPAMVSTVKVAMEQGVRFEIFTARVSGPPEEAIEAKLHIKAWLKEHGLPNFAITANKKKKFRQFWDDRAVSVTVNTGVLNHG